MRPCGQTPILAPDGAIDGAGARPHAVAVRWSVRRRILAVLVAVTFIGMGVAGAAAYLAGRQSVINGIDQRLSEQISAARLIALDGQGGSPFATTRDALEAIVGEVLPDPNAATLGMLDGQAAFAPGVDVPFDLAAEQDFLTRVLDEVSDGSVRLGTAATGAGELRYIAAPVAIDDQRGVFVIAVDIAAELDDFTAAVWVYVPAALGMLAVIALVGWLVAGRLLAPLRKLRQAAEEITAGDRSIRIPVTGRDDVSELTRTVNGMLDRLDAALTGQRQLLDDVRHELKTPITIVRGHLELMDPADAGDVASTRLIAIDELDRMSGLIDEIELLAESRLVPVARTSVPAAELTREVFDKARGIASHEWRLAESAAGSVSVDRSKIAQAWLQLVDNAVKYSPAGSPILIGSTDHGDAVEFWVQDSGPGIPPGQEVAIFERHGRAHGPEIPGSGLGLSIVRSIVMAHGGRVGAASMPTGARIGFLLPLEPVTAGGREAVPA